MNKLCYYGNEMITNIWQLLAFQFFSVSLSSIRSWCDERLSWAEEDTTGDLGVSISSKSPDSVASPRAGSFACLSSVVFLISSLTIKPLDSLYTCLCAGVGGGQRLTLGVYLCCSASCFFETESSSKLRLWLLLASTPFPPLRSNGVTPASTSHSDFLI